MQVWVTNEPVFSPGAGHLSQDPVAKIEQFHNHDAALHHSRGTLHGHDAALHSLRPTVLRTDAILRLRGLSHRVGAAPHYPLGLSTDQVRRHIGSIGLSSDAMQGCIMPVRLSSEAVRWCIVSVGMTKIVPQLCLE
jgi:hypothetical protein